MAESYCGDLGEHPAKRSFDVAQALCSHPVDASYTGLTALPKIALPKENFPVKHPRSDKDVEIKQPTPRRFASHPVLMHRASSITSSLYPRSTSDSPGPPPPRSPLRLRRDPRTIESIIASHDSPRKETPKSGSNFQLFCEHNHVIEPIKPTVVTDCTGPIKRPKSRTKDSVARIAHHTSRKEREERIRARKLRDKPHIARAIDAVVHAPPSMARHRLRKARPQIHIPTNLHPAPLVTRASSSASSNASWKKITETTRTPVSPVPSQDTSNADGETTGYTPISPTASRESTMALSPVMLVAEEVPAPKMRSTTRPAKLVVEKGKYAPSPRSASMSRNSKRRSRTSMQMPSGANSPHENDDDEAPPLPSPPPNRALPPTPPASGSEKPNKVKLPESNKKDLPMPPMYEINPKDATSAKTSEHVLHVASQAQRKSIGPKEVSKAARIDARLEALEKHNALLEAALWAVLKTNGSLNGPLSSVVSDSAESPKSPMAWESRVARRSAASHSASNSNGSALDLYLHTRRGSKHGC